MLWLLDAVLLPVGRVVRLHGLRGREQLNGRRAVVAGPRRSDTYGSVRYPVRPLGMPSAEEVLSVRPQNMAPTV